MQNMDIGINTLEYIISMIVNNKKRSVCIIGAGPNGAGKSTLIKSLNSNFEYLNFDQIVKELEVDRFSLKAGKILHKRFFDLINGQISFIYETVLADKTKFLENAILEMKDKRYYIILIYTWLSSVDECKRRIRKRVKEKGHFVPDYYVNIRYHRSLDNYLNRYLFQSDFSLCYNNDVEPELVFYMEENIIKVYNDIYWRKMLNR